MGAFSLTVAGHTAAVRSLFESTPAYLSAYVTENEPEFTITVTPEDLVFEQAELAREAEEEGFRPRIFTDPFLERAAIQRKMAEYLFDRDVVLFHGSTVAVDGYAYLFTAPCGTGKSTHTRLWRQVFGERALMVNDDKPFLALTEQGVVAYGTPWSGKHGLDTNIAVPLAGICILERGKENRVERISPREVLPFLLKQGLRPLEEAKGPLYEEKIRRLSCAVPLWRMQCNKDPEAAKVAFEAMHP